MDIRPALPAEAPALASLGARLFRETYTGRIPEAELEAYIASSFHAPAQLAELQAPGALLVALEGEEPIAYAKLRLAQAPHGLPITLEIARFYLDQRWHGSGIAASLMAAVFAWGAERGHAQVWLQAWEENPRALAFYKRQGFQDQGPTTFTVGDIVYRDRVLTCPTEAPRG
jgi:GNAT superfamily N-acetyltransferase